MDFLDVIEGLKAKANPETPNPEPTGNPLDTMPEGMPLTNRLDRMTVEQAEWAITNGTVWIAYLKELKPRGVDVDIVENTAQPIEVSDAEIDKAIGDILDSLWLELTDNMKRPYLENHQIPDWVEKLQWAIKALPKGYEKHRDVYAYELKEYQEKLIKPKKRRDRK